MKPKFDLNSPLVKFMTDYSRAEAKKALQIEQTVEGAVIPIFSIPKSKAHQKPKKKPEQLGTGVLVKIKDYYFIFSATHVFIEFEGKNVFTAAPGHFSPLEALLGERHSSGKFPSLKVDQYDATVFHIQSELSDNLKRIAITLDDMELTGFDDFLPIFMISGFLAKKSNISGNVNKITGENFPTIEIEEYEEYGYDEESQILLSFPDQVLIGNQWKTAPRPRGMSGGAIIKAQGTSTALNTRVRKVKKQLLAAITIEHYPDHNKKLGFLLGTRINVHLGLIYQQVPELKDFFDDYFN